MWRNILCDHRLAFDEILIFATFLNKLVVRSVVNNLMIRHDHNLISALNGRETMSDDDDSAAMNDVFNRFLYQVLRLGIQG